MKNFYKGDRLIAGFILIIGLTEAAHLITVFSGRSLTFCVRIWSVFMCAAVAVFAFAFIFYIVKNKKTDGFSLNLKTVTPVEYVLYAVFAIFFLSQLIFICMGNTVYRERDMTVETVGSFLTSDGIYRVNPMTGRDYTGGIPSRLKILCLPTLGACLCRITGLSPQTVMWRVIPAFVLVCCYTAFGLLAKALFPEEGERPFRTGRACFMAAVALLLWVGTFRYGQDGFGILYSGFRGETVRNCVLIPWALSLCIRRKRLPALLCVPAEACIVWTLYGCGACLAVIAGMTIAQEAGRVSERLRAARAGKEAPE